MINSTGFLSVVYTKQEKLCYFLSLYKIIIPLPFPLEKPHPHNNFDTGISFFYMFTNMIIIVPTMNRCYILFAKSKSHFIKEPLSFSISFFLLCLHFLFYNIDKDSPQKILPNKTTRFWLLTWAFSCVLWDLFEQINKIYVYSAFTPLPFGKELFLSY